MLKSRVRDVRFHFIVINWIIIAAMAQCYYFFNNFNDAPPALSKSLNVRGGNSKFQSSVLLSSVQKLLVARTHIADLMCKITFASRNSLLIYARRLLWSRTIKVRYQKDFIAFKI